MAPLVALSASACAHPENYRWSDARDVKFSSNLQGPEGSRFGNWAKPAVSVYSFPTPGPTTSDPSLRDLSDQGQAALIAALSRDGSKVDDIRESLAGPLRARAAPVEGAVTVEGSYRRTLVANVTKGWDARPGERLVRTWIRVRPLNFRFEGYTVIATDTQVLNIAQFTNATNFGLNANLGQSDTDTRNTTTAIPPVSTLLSSVEGATGGLGATFSNSRTTNATINQQYTRLGADIDPFELRILRESERNLDVAGNTLINLTLKIDPDRWRLVDKVITWRVSKLDVLTDAGALQRPVDLVFDAAVNEAPPYCPLVADVTLFYEYRRVANGRSYIEGDHQAAYEQNQYNVPMAEIVSADEIRRPSWRVYADRQTHALQARDALGTNLPLDFTSYDQARNFAQWLTANIDSMRTENGIPIGKKGLYLSSGTFDGIVSSGAYTARQTPVPADIATTCAKLLPEAAGSAQIPIPIP